MTDFERVEDQINSSDFCSIERRAALSLLNPFGTQKLYEFLMELASRCKDDLITCYSEGDVTQTTVIKCDHLRGC